MTIGSAHAVPAPAESGATATPFLAPDRRALVEQNVDLARRLASRYRNRGEPSDDLEQVAGLALCRAANRFDPSRGVDFRTYATPTILGELKRHFRDNCWSVHVPRAMQELRIELRIAAASLAQDLGRHPTIGELADSLGVSVEEVLATEQASEAYNTDTIDGRRTNDDSAPQLADTRLGQTDEGFRHVEEHQVASKLIGRLREPDRTVVWMRYFGDITQSEIGDQIGVSQMQVSRILDRALRRMRAIGA